MKNLYSTLGLANNASAAEIENALLIATIRQYQQYDADNSKPMLLDRNSPELAAYAVLSNPKLKGKYDISHAIYDNASDGLENLMGVDMLRRHPDVELSIKRSELSRYALGFNGEKNYFEQLGVSHDVNQEEVLAAYVKKSNDLIDETAKLHKIASDAGLETKTVTYFRQAQMSQIGQACYELLILSNREYLVKEASGAITLDDVITRNTQAAVIDEMLDAGKLMDEEDKSIAKDKFYELSYTPAERAEHAERLAKQDLENAQNQQKDADFEVHKAGFSAVYIRYEEQSFHLQPEYTEGRINGAYSILKHSGKILIGNETIECKTPVEAIHKLESYVAEKAPLRAKFDEVYGRYEAYINMNSSEADQRIGERAQYDRIPLWEQLSTGKTTIGQLEARLNANVEYIEAKREWGNGGGRYEAGWFNANQFIPSQSEPVDKILQDAAQLRRSSANYKEVETLFLDPARFGGDKGLMAEYYAEAIALCVARKGNYEQGFTNIAREFPPTAKGIDAMREEIKQRDPYNVVHVSFVAPALETLSQGHDKGQGVA